MNQHLLLLLGLAFAISVADGATSPSSGDGSFTLMRRLTEEPDETGETASSSSNETSIPSNESPIIEEPNETDEPDEIPFDESASRPDGLDETNEILSNETTEEPYDEIDETGEPDGPSDETYDRIMAMHNQTFPHRCFVAVIDGGPVVWCDINVPMNLNVTAEIRDGTCDEFTTTASSDFFTMGIAQPIFVPEVTEEEKLMGTFDHSYCAGVDIFYNDVNVTTGDAQQVSLLSGRFAMEITYSYDEKVNEESGKIEEELTSAVLSDENSKVEEGNKDLQIGLGVLAGAVVTLALVAIVYGKKKKTSRRRQEENIEIARMVVPINEENEII